ncbi:hypothetical protein [Streptomyces sp. NPDC058694]
MTSKFMTWPSWTSRRPEEFMDHYTDALTEVIKAKQEGHALPAKPKRSA